MCGRIALLEPSERLARLFDAVVQTGTTWQTSWNVPPTSPVPLVVAREPAADPAHRTLTTARWGLVPSWASDPSIGNRLFNARAETVASTPAFRTAARRRRAIVPVSGFYEWQGTPRSRRAPWLFTRSDGMPMALAALWEWWPDRAPRPHGAGADPCTPLTSTVVPATLPGLGPTPPSASPEPPSRSCTIVTTAAGPDVEAVHHRMPVILEPDDWDRWLDPTTTDVDEVRDLLRPAPVGTLRAERREPAGARPTGR